MNSDQSSTTEHDAEGDAVIGACFEVHHEMGNGFLGDVCQESLELELTPQA